MKNLFTVDGEKLCNGGTISLNEINPSDGINSWDNEKS